MLRANLSSVLPPKFRENTLHSVGTGWLLHCCSKPDHHPLYICTVDLIRYRFPVTWENVGAYLYYPAALCLC